MKNPGFLKKVRPIILSLQIVAFLSIVILGMAITIGLKPELIESLLTKHNREATQTTENNNANGKDEPLIENGIHLSTGFIVDEGYEQVITTCTACHSAKLVTQNRATREGWLSMIRWMQATQNLWDLGENEKVIVNYLSKNYAPVKMGRRKNLENIEWYVLDENNK